MSAPIGIEIDRPTLTTSVGYRNQDLAVRSEAAPDHRSGLVDDFDGKGAGVCIARAFAPDERRGGGYLRYQVVLACSRIVEFDGAGHLEIHDQVVTLDGYHGDTLLYRFVRIEYVIVVIQRGDDLVGAVRDVFDLIIETTCLQFRSQPGDHLVCFRVQKRDVDDSALNRGEADLAADSAIGVGSRCQRVCGGLVGVDRERFWSHVIAALPTL